MDFKQLDNDYQKYLFLREYNERSNMNVPLAYVQECKIFGAFIDGQMVGGFAFSYGDDMAWPQVIQSEVPFFKSIPKSMCLEINLVWAKDKLHKSYSEMLRFWLKVTSLAGRDERAEYITYAVDDRHKYLVSMYQRLSVGKIYRGEIPKYPGRKAIVFYTSKFRCKYAKFICIQEFYIRYKRKIMKENSSYQNLEPSLAVNKTS